MGRLAAVACALLTTLFSTAVSAQEPTTAQQTTALQQVVNDQLRRIEALEARLAELQQQMEALRKPPPVTATALPAPSTESASDEPPMEVPYEHAFSGEPPENPDGEGPAADLPRALNVDSYGSLRVLMLVDTDGHSEVTNNASRLGLRGEKPLIGRLVAFGRYEMGVNMVANDRAILLTGGDPGTPIGQGSQAVSTRLGYVGVRTPIGNFSFGKQWAPYYDISEFTDQLQIFTGTANGAFGAFTDGGIAGTGRAERAFLYRETWGPLGVALQMQNRSLTVHDRDWADTYSGSLILGKLNGFAVGTAFNKVRDGVPIPTINEPQQGDQATIVGARYRGESFYAGTTFAILKQHEIDDLGRRFDGKGFELALRQHFTPRTWIEGAYNDQRPDADHPGDYRLRFVSSNIVYNFNVASRVFFGFRLDKSRRSDRTPLTDDTFAAGLNYTF